MFERHAIYVKRFIFFLGVFLALSGTVTTAAFSARAAVVSRNRVLIVGLVSSLRRRWVPADADGLDVLTLEFVPPGHHEALAVVRKIANIAGVYDPTDGSFKRIDPTAAHCLDATSLMDGRVLLTGCSTGTTGSKGAGIYDPSTDRFLPTGSMSEPRNGYSTTLLKDGRVLIAGGRWGEFLASAELYDPKLGTFLLSGRMMVPRSEHSATVLATGKVLLTGGVTTGTGTARGLTGSTTNIVLSSAELYDPMTGRFIDAGHTNHLRADHSSTLLKDGKVLIVGGAGEPGADTSKTAEVYDPSVAGFLPLNHSMMVGRTRHAAVLESDGSVLIACGDSDGSRSPVTPSADIFDQQTGVFGQPVSEMDFGLPFGGAAPTTPCLALSLNERGSIVIGANVGTISNDHMGSGIPVSAYDSHEKRFRSLPSIPLDMLP